MIMAFEWTIVNLATYRQYTNAAWDWMIKKTKKKQINDNNNNKQIIIIKNNINNNNNTSLVPIIYRSLLFLIVLNKIKKETFYDF